MAETVQIIYPCDHIIQENTNCYGEIEMKRNIDTSFSDSISNNVTMLRVDMVYTIDSNGKKIYYYNGYNYNQALSLNILEWTDDKAPNNPTPGSTYYVLGFFIKTSITKYEDSNCSRCGGNGWYVSFISINGVNVNKIEGTAKLAQDFIKVLYTEKNIIDGYGSIIKDIIGISVYDPNSVNAEIISAIDDCVESIKNGQKQAILDSVVIDDEEMLSEVRVRDIQYIREENTFYISLMIINILGQSIKFNFKI